MHINMIVDHYCIPYCLGNGSEKKRVCKYSVQTPVLPQVSSVHGRLSLGLWRQRVQRLMEPCLKAVTSSCLLLLFAFVMTTTRRGWEVIILILSHCYPSRVLRDKSREKVFLEE